MIAFKKYLRRLYRVLAVIAVLIGILVFTTGKTSLTENINLISEYLSSNSPETGISSNTETTTNSGISKSDNLVTTIVKTFFVIIAIIFLTFATIISAILELIIWVVSWGANSFYCTKQIWNLCWHKIVSDWYWVPSNNTYLWITFLLYSGLFGTKSVDKNQQLDNPKSNKRNYSKSRNKR